MKYFSIIKSQPRSTGFSPIGDTPIRIFLKKTHLVGAERKYGFARPYTLPFGQGYTKNQHVTIPEMAQNIGITERAIEKNLKEHHIVERQGGERSGFWKILISE